MSSSMDRVRLQFVLFLATITVVVGQVSSAPVLDDTTALIILSVLLGLSVLICVSLTGCIACVCYHKRRLGGGTDGRSKEGRWFPYHLRRNRTKNVSLLSSAANPVYEQFTPPEMKQGRYKTISENSLRDIDMDLFQSQRSPVSQEESLQDKYTESNFVEDTTVKHRRIPSSKERSPGKVVSEAQRSKKEDTKETALDQPHTPNTKDQPGEKVVTPRQTLAVREITPVKTSITPKSRPKIPADYKAKPSDTPKLKPPPPSSRGSSPRTTRKSALAAGHLSPEKDDESAKPRTPKAQRYVDFLTPESHHTPKSKMKTSSSNVEGASKTKKASSQKITRAKSHQFQLKREMEYNEIDTILRDAQKLFS